MCAYQDIARYFPAAKAARCGTACSTVGHTTIRPQTAYPAHPDRHPPDYMPVEVGRSLPELHIVYIPAGQGRFTDDSGSVSPVRPGTVMLLQPGMPHAYSPHREDGWEEYWVGCIGPYPEWIVRERGFFPAKPLRNRSPLFPSVIRISGQSCHCVL